MIIRKQLKSGKVSITSSYFDDARLIKASLRDSMQEDYVPAKWRNGAGRDFSELKLATAVQFIILSKQGAEEIKKYLEPMNTEQFKNLKVNWGPWVDYESYDDLVAIRDGLLQKQSPIYTLTAEESKELDRVNNEIRKIDDFVAAEMAKPKLEVN